MNLNEKIHQQLSLLRSLDWIEFTMPVVKGLDYAHSKKNIYIYIVIILTIWHTHKTQLIHHFRPFIGLCVCAYVCLYTYTCVQPIESTNNYALTQWKTKIAGLYYSLHSLGTQSHHFYSQRYSHKQTNPAVRLRGTDTGVNKLGLRGRCWCHGTRRQ